MCRDHDSELELFYGLARTPEEAERLHLQSVFWQEATSRVLDQLELKPGMTCMDLGCGGGSVMLALGQRVGPTGSVLGVDTDLDLGQRVVNELNKTGASQFSFLEADVTAPTFEQTGTFDVTSARFLLVHLADPITTLQTMWRMTKPGGVMVVLDYDFRSHAFHPMRSEFEEFVTVFDGVFKYAGQDPLIGTKLPHYFERAGVGSPDGTDVSCYVKPISILQKSYVMSYQSMLPAALKLGVTTEKRAEQFMAFLQDPNEHDNSYSTSALYCGVWKKKDNV